MVKLHFIHVIYTNTKYTEVKHIIPLTVIISQIVCCK